QASSIPPITPSHEGGAVMTMLDRFLDWRNRMVMRVNFRQWAARFPVTRPVARRQSAELFDICSGFVKTQTLLACVRCGLLDALADGARSHSDLMEETRLPADGLDRLLAAACALKLVSKRARGLYGLGALGPAIVGDPGILAMIEHNAIFYRDLADPVSLLKATASSTELRRYWAYSGNESANELDESEVRQYSILMAESQRMVAAEILSAYPVNKHNWLLDVGGGQGAFVTAAGHSVPKLKISVFDLPAVVERASALISTSGLGDRFEAFGGDFFTDQLPMGPDLVSLVRVLHDHDDTEAFALLCNIRRSLKQGATLIIAEPMAGLRESAAVGDIYFGFYMLAMGKGRVRTPHEIRDMAMRAGFASTRLIPTNTPVITQIVAASD
ncbi:MAG: methyltransferase, partial [Anderseniella sp.]